MTPAQRTTALDLARSELAEATAIRESLQEELRRAVEREATAMLRVKHFERRARP